MILTLILNYMKKNSINPKEIFGFYTEKILNLEHKITILENSFEQSIVNNQKLSAKIQALEEKNFVLESEITAIKQKLASDITEKQSSNNSFEYIDSVEEPRKFTEYVNKTQVKNPEKCRILSKG